MKKNNKKTILKKVGERNVLGIVFEYFIDKYGAVYAKHGDKLEILGILSSPENENTFKIELEGYIPSELWIDDEGKDETTIVDIDDYIFTEK